MAMGRRRDNRQQALWVHAPTLEKVPGSPFYERLAKLLEKHDFEDFTQELCRPFYAERQGRPSIAPPVYFKALLIGYFEGIESERGIAWRIADSLSLRKFLGFAMDDPTPNHSTLSRTRRLLGIETHEAFFEWILKILAKEGLLDAKTLGIDATTLEADAALRSLVRRDSNETYQEFLARIAKESGIENPSAEDLARFDRNRPKKTSNKDWRHPHDPDARIGKMKRGNFRMLHKAEHAIDLETGAIVTVTLQPGDRGDTTSLNETLEQAHETLHSILDDEEVAAALSNELASEIVADKGYHSNKVLENQRSQDVRTYIAEPERGRRRWKNKKREQKAVYANRRRNKGQRGRRLHRRRSELVERSFAHCYDTGGMRRVYLHGHENIRKRVLIHAAGHNLGLVMRKLCGAGTPRGLRDRFSFVHAFLEPLIRLFRTSMRLLDDLLSIRPLATRAAQAEERWPLLAVGFGESTFPTASYGFVGIWSSI